MPKVPTRIQMDMKAYVDRTRSGVCFICALVAKEPWAAHHVIAEDADTIIFLSKYPTVPGYTIVSPKRHLEDLAEDQTPDDYVALQRRVHTAARALKRVYRAERIYVLSLGIAQGNAHLHWHVVPLPPGVPYEQQQYHTLMAENGVLDFTEGQLAEAATRIGNAYRTLMAGAPNIEKTP